MSVHARMAGSVATLSNLESFASAWQSCAREVDEALAGAEVLGVQFAAMHEVLASRLLDTSNAAPPLHDAGLLQQLQEKDALLAKVREDNARLRAEQRSIRRECLDAISDMQAQCNLGVPVEKVRELEQQWAAERESLSAALDRANADIARLQQEGDAERKRAADELFALRMDYDIKLQKALRSSSGASQASGADREVFRKKTQLIHAQYQGMCVF
jgi:hypothetical protein